MVAKMLLPSAREHSERDERQRSVLAWCKEAFGQGNGDHDEASPETRLQRFIEEAIELGQAFGLSKEMVLKQVDITYDRDKGEVYQEIGGVMVTLNAFCEASGHSLASCEAMEIERCNTKPIEHFQRRQKEKRAQGL